jgi:hypothetical protein
MGRAAFFGVWLLAGCGQLSEQSTPPTVVEPKIQPGTNQVYEFRDITGVTGYLNRTITGASDDGYTISEFRLNKDGVPTEAPRRGFLPKDLGWRWAVTGGKVSHFKWLRFPLREGDRWTAEMTHRDDAGKITATCRVAGVSEKYKFGETVFRDAVKVRCSGTTERSGGFATGIVYTVTYLPQLMAIAHVSFEMPCCHTSNNSWLLKSVGTVPETPVMDRTAGTQWAAQTPWPDFMPTLVAGPSSSPIAAVRPDDARVIPPASDVPADKRRWSGNWAGWACSDRACDTKLVVETVTADSATIVYSFASAQVGKTMHRVEARFIGNELQATLPSGSQITYRMREEGSIEFLWRRDTRSVAGLLTKE